MTKVVSSDGDNVGYVYVLMVNKCSGQAAYAALSIGGFVSIGKVHADWVASHYGVANENLSLG